MNWKWEVARANAAPKQSLVERARLTGTLLVFSFWPASLSSTVSCGHRRQLPNTGFARPPAATGGPPLVPRQKPFPRRVFSAGRGRCVLVGFIAARAVGGRVGRAVASAFGNTDSAAHTPSGGCNAASGAVSMVTMRRWPVRTSMRHRSAFFIGAIQTQDQSHRDKSS